MKNIIKTLLAITLISGFTSCDNDENLMFVSPPASFQILSPSSGDGVILDPLTPNNPALSLTWDPAVYGTATEITYTVEVDKNGEDFDTPYILATSVNTYVTITSEQLNTAAGTVGMEPGNEGGLDVRIMATVGTTGSEPSYSNVITYSVTPYLSYLFKDFYLVGGATAPGWSNNNNNPALWRDPSDSKYYEFVGYFNSGEFKVLEVLGLWQPQWGTLTDGGFDLAGNPGTQSNDPFSFKNLGAAGYYKFTFNMNSDEMNYSIEPYTGSTATTYTSVGIIGSATPGGWDSETALTQSSFDPHLWYIETIALSNGEAKFRANNGWDINWGGNTQYSGTGSQNGPNIPVTATNYKVWFFDLTGQYMLIPIVE
jgi:hypothetical protein